MTKAVKHTKVRGSLVRGAFVTATLLVAPATTHADFSDYPLTDLQILAICDLYPTFGETVECLLSFY